MPKDEAKLLEVPPRTRAIADSPTVSTPGSGLHDKAAEDEAAHPCGVREPDHVSRKPPICSRTAFTHPTGHARAIPTRAGPERPS